jgi:DNA-binding HxlR family transcriptional regulator
VAPKIELEARRSSCPVACTLDLFGDRWTLLVLRDLFLGKQHYDEFLQASEGIATNILAERLKRLQAMGLIGAEIDETNRRRKRYSLTERGRSLGPILLQVARWGIDHIDGTQASAQALPYLKDRPR